MGGKNQGLGSSNSSGQPNFWRTKSIEVHTFQPYLLGLASHPSSNIYIYTPYTHAVLFCYGIFALSLVCYPVSHCGLCSF